MITKQRQLFYFVGDKPYASLEEAQKADLIQLMPDSLCRINTCGDDTVEQKQSFAKWLIENSKAIVDTLTTTPRSRLRARKSHGAKPKQSKTKPASANPY